jgi:WD40 repeat protein
MTVLAFSRDGKLLLTASEDGTAKVWDFDARKSLYTIDAGVGAVRSAAFSPDGNLIATGHFGKYVTLLWDAKTGKAVPRPKTFGVHTGTVRSVAFSGKLIMTASADGSIKFWNVETGELMPHMSIGSEDRTGPYRSALFSPDGMHVVTATDQGDVRLWQTRSGKLIQELTAGAGETWKASFDPDGARIAIASGDQTSVWRVPTVQQLVDQAKATVPRCLTPDERSRFFLTADPPEWCGEKWPYNTPELKLAPRPPRLEGMFQRWFGVGTSDD